MEALTIGQLAKLAGVEVGTIRFYERQGLLPKPARADSGYRRYARDMVARLRFIAGAKDLQFTLSEIRQLLALLDGPGTRAEVRTWADRKIDDLDRQVRTLLASRNALDRLRKSCTEDGPATGCPILLAIGGNSGATPGVGSGEGPPAG